MTKRDQAQESTASRSALTCPMCESQKLVTRHCKRFCERCGYVESCEDNFWPNQQNPKEVAPPAS